MESIFSDDGVDLLQDNQELPSDDENRQHNDADLFHADEATGEGEEAAIKVEPKKRSIRNPRPRLTIETLSGPRGIQTIENYFKDIQFKGKGYEKYDLNEIMRRLQHWGHRMYPTYKFDDILANIERLGKKKPLHVHMTRYRLGMINNMQSTQDDLLVDNEQEDGVAVDEPFDEFDALLDEQIAISKLEPRTPQLTSVGNSNRRPSATSTASSSHFKTPYLERANAVNSTPYTAAENLNDFSDLAIPLPPSQPNSEVGISKQPEAEKSSTKLTAEQMAKITENRRLAQERLRARQQQQQQQKLSADP